MELKLYQLVKNRKADFSHLLPLVTEYCTCGLDPHLQGSLAVLCCFELPLFCAITAVFSVIIFVFSTSSRLIQGNRQLFHFNKSIAPFLVLDSCGIAKQQWFLVSELFSTRFAIKPQEQVCEVLPTLQPRLAVLCRI